MHRPRVWGPKRVIHNVLSLTPVFRRTLFEDFRSISKNEARIYSVELSDKPKEGTPRSIQRKEKKVRYEYEGLTLEHLAKHGAHLSESRNESEPLRQKYNQITVASSRSSPGLEPSSVSRMPLACVWRHIHA